MATYLNEVMQAVVITACEKHAPALLEKVGACPDGNWFMMPTVAGRSGYWPHVSESRPSQGCAIFGFAERQMLLGRLQEFMAVNDDGSLCPDCAAYEWNVATSHGVETTRDPVCGRNVSCSSAPMARNEGELFCFCSIGCRDKFESSPQTYVKTKNEEPVLV